MSDQNSEIQSLFHRWGVADSRELLDHMQHSSGTDHIIDCIWHRGWSVDVFHIEPGNVRAELNLNNDFDGPQYVSDNRDLMPRSRDTDELEALLMVYVAALEESLACVPEALVVAGL